jgi:hypothetical protein
MKGCCFYSTSHVSGRRVCGGHVVLCICTCGRPWLWFGGCTGIVSPMLDTGCAAQGVVSLAFGDAFALGAKSALLLQ